MGERMQQTARWIAMLAVACHVLISGLAPSLAAIPAFDPYNVTCLNGGHQAAEPGTALPGGTASHNCDQCMLCGATPAPAAPVTATPVVFSPQRVEQPAALQTTPHHCVVYTPALPRGPPTIA